MAKMQRSFSIVEDNNSSEDFDDEQVLKKYGNVLNEGKISEMTSDLGKKVEKVQLTPPEINSDSKKLSPSAGFSSRQSIHQSRSSAKNSRMSSESDLEDSDIEETKNKNIIPGEYDSKEFENLEVNPEIKELFQYITKYIPQQMTLDHKFKPFVPEFLPAVGDIDAFLKVIPPSGLLSGKDFITNQQLGLAVLDEPAANQSDAALLHLQLRAESVKTTHDSDVVVKKIGDVEKNAKIIDKWIKDISALHKSKSFPAVKYTDPMPDLDELMEEWSEEMENKLKKEGFPEPKGDLQQYIEEVCEIFQIPVRDKLQSLHVFVSLYAAVKSSELYKSTQIGKNDLNEDKTITNTDQLVLE